MFSLLFFFFFQEEDGIRDLVRSRGLGDVYKRQALQLVSLMQESVQVKQCWEAILITANRMLAEH